MAVLVQSLAFVIMAQWFRSAGGVVHPLTRRYIFLSSAIKKDLRMNVDKAKKRILKRVQRGFKGYPQIS
ncbi:hypothetical protein O4H50_21535, partial [Vibrio diazotrophicus]|nr:hypothetical protein [Vibrio diazotrophicus]